MKKSLPKFISLSLAIVLCTPSFNIKKSTKTATKPAFDHRMHQVSISPWTTVSWSTVSSNYGNCLFPVPELTETIIEKAVILRFAKWESTESFFALPLALDDEAMLSMVFTAGVAELYYFSEEPIAPPSIQFSYVLVEAGEDWVGDSQKFKESFYQEMGRAGVDVKDYEGVVEYLSIGEEYVVGR